MIFDFIEQTSLLIISALLSLMIIAALWNIKRLSPDKLGHGAIYHLNKPFFYIRKMAWKKHKLTAVMETMMFTVFAVSAYVSLSRRLPVWLALLLCLPAAVVVAAVVIQVVWQLALLFSKAVALDNPRLTTLFAAAVITLTAVCASFFVYDMKLTYVFIMVNVNLLICYCLVLLALLQLLKEATGRERNLTFRNLWKSTLIIFVLFILVLSLMSYSGLTHFEWAFAYDGALSFFDMLYYTCVTLATVGYGDIVPNNPYEKAVSILTIVTGVISITILLSAMMSVKKSNDD